MMTVSSFVFSASTGDLRTYLESARAERNGAVTVLAGGLPLTIPVSVIEAELVARMRCD